jgi:uncharacterized membrane protein YhaH (DUF805 family)
LDFLHQLNLQEVLALLVYLVEVVVLDHQPLAQDLLVLLAFLVVLVVVLVLVLA